MSETPDVPKKCPICGAGIVAIATRQRDERADVSYECGIKWWTAIGSTGRVMEWYGSCPDAMKVALEYRTAPTTPTTPAAAARDALVAAGLTLYSAEMVWRNSSLGDNGKRLSVAFDNFFKVAAAYLAAQEQPQ